MCANNNLKQKKSLNLRYLLKSKDFFCFSIFHRRGGIGGLAESVADPETRERQKKNWKRQKKKNGNNSIYINNNS